ncbi:MAG: polyprenyl synthetase family protein [Syntrophales bacterium LBB04]|nr:polyprenyl synthetase family protein [Syntrophales bacterium LBB04]
MASPRLEMPRDFHAYLGIRKPFIEEAFSRKLGYLLDTSVVEARRSLVTALEAGKKIRGCLTCLLCDALGGTLESAVPRAVAVELVQAATLIHDDYVDQDTIRGDVPSVWTIEGPRRAVLIGDVIFASAIEMMSQAGSEDARAISHAIAEISKGALHEPLDPLLFAREIECNRIHDRLYEKIIHLKTGMLFGTACRMGAIAAGAQERLAEKCYRYGLLIGEAYQIADDLKEVKNYLAIRSIQSAQMVAVAPALLRFIFETRAHVSDFLRRTCTTLDDSDLQLFRTVAKLMEEEIEDRLESAESEIDGDFPGNDYTRLARKAPRDIIRMFNESS